MVGDSASSLKARPVKLGGSNEQFVVIEKALKRDQVAMNPRQYDKVVFTLSIRIRSSQKRSGSGKKKSQPPDNVEPDSSKRKRLRSIRSNFLILGLHLD